MSTTAPAHVELVKELSEAVRVYHTVCVTGIKALIEPAIDRQVKACQALYDALAQPALAAPVLQEVSDSKAIEAALMSLPRFDYGYRSDEWGTGRSLGFIAKADGPAVRFADVASFLTAQQPTPTVSPEQAPTASEMPVQPLCITEHGRIRFKENRIVRAMLDHGLPLGYGLNEIARGDFTPDERMQLAQLIGYSLSGYG